MKTELINIDLELYSDKPIKLLAQELKGKAFILSDGLNEDNGYEFRAEVSSGGNSDSIDSIIHKFITLLQGIRLETKDIINNCHIKVFNIGIESGGETYCEEFNLSPESINGINELGFGVAISVYKESEYIDKAT